jgi:hypothetical protein
MRVTLLIDGDDRRRIGGRGGHDGGAERAHLAHVDDVATKEGDPREVSSRKAFCDNGRELHAVEAADDHPACQGFFRFVRGARGGGHEGRE